MDFLLKHEPGFFIWEVIIFIIVLFILKRYAWKPLLGYLEERRNRITDTLVAADKMTEEIQKLRIEHEMIKFQTQKQIADMQSSAIEYVNTMLEEARTKAKKEYKKVIDDAEKEVIKMRNDAINDIKRKTGALVIQVAEEVLRNSLKEDREQDDHIRRLVGDINFNKPKY